MTLKQMQKIMGMGGAATLGYTGIVEGTPLAAPLGSSLSNAQRTVTAPAHSAGDILVAIAANGPDVPGMGSVTLRTPTFQIWTTGGGVTHFNTVQSRFCLEISPRIATGDSEDDCLIFGQGSPTILHVIALTGNPWAGTPANILADNENSQNTADTTMFRENLPAPWDWTFRVAATVKDVTSASSVICTGFDNTSPLQFMRGIATGLDFNAMIMGICWGLFPTNGNDPGTGAFTQSGAVTDYTASVSLSLKSGDT